MKRFAIEFRERMLRKLSLKKGAAKPAEVLEAEKVIAKYREEQENLEPQLSRLESSECPDSVCPKCFYMRGISVHLHELPGDDEKDLYQCNECKNTYEEIA